MARYLLVQSVGYIGEFSNFVVSSEMTENDVE